MQGIIKSSHQKLCDSLQDLKNSLPVQDHKINELEMELQTVFAGYQQKMNEIKRIINLYTEKQKSIKNEIKRIRKFSMPDSKKTDKRALSKAVF